MIFEKQIMDLFKTQLDIEDAPPQERYLFKPFIGSSHLWALKQLASLSNDARVLDVGAGGGGIGRTLEARGITDLFAVEIDPRADKDLSPTYKKIARTLDQYDGEKFDAILLLDIIEHTSNPQDYLEKAYNLLNPSGILLVSVPNIAHWSIRIALIFGYFEYTSRGILDPTHQQFFTRKRILKMLEISKFEICESSGSVVPIELLLPVRWRTAWPVQLFAKFRTQAVKLAPSLCAYQHLIKATL
jgi:2-polyprenyl-3-methyl-5-hydroxy-6-metoxy-1,4-benzoquinol methylase